MRAMRCLNLEGRRQDTAKAYLRLRLEDGQRPNLHVCFIRAAGRAGSVRKQENQSAFPSGPIPTDAHLDPMQTMEARKLVIICAGLML